MRRLPDPAMLRHPHASRPVCGRPPRTSWVLRPQSTFRHPNTCSQSRHTTVRLVAGVRRQRSDADPAGGNRGSRHARQHARCGTSSHRRRETAGTANREVAIADHWRWPLPLHLRPAQPDLRRIDMRHGRRMTRLRTFVKASAAIRGRRRHRWAIARPPRRHDRTAAVLGQDQQIGKADGAVAIEVALREGHRASCAHARIRSARSWESVSGSMTPL